MKDKYNDIGDDEIRVLGGKGENQDNKAKAHRPVLRSVSMARATIPVAIPISITLVVLFSLVLPHFLYQKQIRELEVQRLEELKELRHLDSLGSVDPRSSIDVKALPSYAKLPLARAVETGHGFIEMADTVINDIPMRLYLPHQVSMSLHLGTINRADSSILFAAQAADVRADNGGIVGAFVLKGEPKAWGLSKKGYCAIINDAVIVGVADNTPLFEEATEKEGYFFRQFPLVDNGQLVENEQRGKSIRRALCDRSGEIFTVETLTAESFHDFAQALADLGVDQAIYLVGSNAYGWATDSEGQRHEFGNSDPPKKKWENISYLVMRAKS